MISVFRILQKVGTEYAKRPIIPLEIKFGQSRLAVDESKDYGKKLDQFRYFSTPPKGFLSVQRRDSRRGIGTNGTPQARNTLNLPTGTIENIGKDHQAAMPFRFKGGSAAHKLFGPGAATQNLPDFIAPGTPISVFFQPTPRGRD